jgi:hypothetical protein
VAVNGNAYDGGACSDEQGGKEDLKGIHGEVIDCSFFIRNIAMAESQPSHRGGKGRVKVVVV